jgi:hypothetical protein
MNEVGWCAGLLPGLAPAGLDDHEIVLLDVGTGAGPRAADGRHRYLYRQSGGGLASVGDPDATWLSREILARAPVHVRATIALIVDRIGIDIEPLDLGERAVRNWLGACIPQEIGAVTRFHSAVEVVIAHPVHCVRADACEILVELLEQVSQAAFVVIVDLRPRVPRRRPAACFHSGSRT